MWIMGIFNDITQIIALYVDYIMQLIIAQLFH